MYGPPPHRTGFDKDLVIGIVVVAVVVAGAIGGAAWFLLKDNFSPPAPTADQDLQKAYTTFYEQGKLDEGITQYQTLTERFPNEAKVWRDYAQASSFLGTQPAHNLLTPLQKALQLNNQDALTQYFLANVYISDHKYSEAEQSAKSALNINQNSWIGHAALANYYLRVADYTKFRVELEAVQKGAGTAVDDPFYNLTLATLLSNNNQCPQALKYIENPLAKWPKLAAPRLVKAICLGFSNEYKDAETNRQQGFQLILDAQKLQPNSTAVLGTLAKYYTYSAQDTTSAQKYAQEYLNIEPNDTAIFSLLGRVMIFKGEYEQSFKYFEDCVKLDPNYWGCSSEWAWALLGQGLELFKQNKTQEASSFYKQANDKALSIETVINKLPETDTITRANYYYLLGSIQYFMQNFSAAASLFEKAVSYQPKYGNYYAFLGWSYLGVNRVADARAAYEKGIALDPGDGYLQSLGRDLAKTK